MKNKSIFWSGLWLDPYGPIAEDISSYGIDILNVIGKETMSSRVGALKRHLHENPHIETLVAHSAGCLGLATVFQNGGLQGIKQVVLMNSAPMPGVMFMPHDPVFFGMGKYIPKMVLRAPIALTDADTKNFMSLDDSGLEEVRPSLKADDGGFIAEVVSEQFKVWKKPSPGFIQRSLGHSAVWTVTASNDRMIGSCGFRNNKLFDVLPKCQIMIKGGHLTSIMNFGAILEVLRSRGCEI